MASEGNDPGGHGSGGNGLVKSPQNLVGGLALFAFAALCYWAAYDLRGIRGFTFGAGTMPRIFCVLLAILSVAVMISAFFTRGPKLEHFPWRAPLLILSAVAFFGLTIRGFDLGFVQVPGLGLAISGFFTVLLAGSAMDDFRFGEGVLFAVVITAFCCFLFPFALGQPIPLYPPFLR